VTNFYLIIIIIIIIGILVHALQLFVPYRSVLFTDVLSVC